MDREPATIVKRCLVLGGAMVLAALACGQAGAATGTVPTNAALRATSTATYTDGVWRLDYSAGLGAPPLFYRPSASPCPLNSGSGDNGSQVQSADGKCWIAAFDAQVDVRQWGADPTGTNDSVPAVNAALAAAALPSSVTRRVVFPPGMFLIGSTSPSPYPAVSPYPPITGEIGIHLWCSSSSRCSNIEIVGEGATIITSNTANNSDWFGFSFIDNLSIHGLTL